ncbi:hypothetical protein M3Y99_00110900 [Aphelenchoides fujianensis]|nr:hypothetical protein M3Y99_00110900 [Aphelenchoides fujianensis]
MSRKSSKGRRGSLVMPIDHSAHLVSRDNFCKLERDNGPSFGRFVRSYSRHFDSWATFADGLIASIPPLRWLPHYSWQRQLGGDVLAGAVLTLFNIPLAIACSNLAGVPLVNGLYTMLFAVLVYPLVGAWPHGTMGPFAAIDIATGEHARMIMSDFYGDLRNITNADPATLAAVNSATITSAMVFLNGVICIVFGLLRLDFIAEYFSEPLVGGFTSGIALYVVVSQVDGMLGIQKPPRVRVGYEFPNLLLLVQRLNATNWVSVGLSAFSIFFLIGCKTVVQPAMQRWCHRRCVVLPWEFVLVALSIAFSAFFRLNERYGVYIVGEIPNGLPLPALPNFSLLPDLFPSSLAISTVQLCTHMFAMRVLSRRVGYRVDRRQETYAMGTTLLISGFFPVYAANNGLGQSSILEQAGGTSQISTVVMAVIMVFIVLFGGPFFYYLPTCVMAVVVLIVVGKQLNGIFEVPHLWKASKWDFCIWTATFLASVTRGIVLGLGIGIVFQLFTVVARTQWPRWTVWYSKRPDRANVCIFEFESMLLFTNGEKFVYAVQETLEKWCSDEENDEKKTQDHVFVLDCTAMIDVDAVGLGYLVDVLKDLHRFAAVFFVKPRWFLIKLLREEGVNISDHTICETVEEALERAERKRPPFTLHRAKSDEPPLSVRSRF